MSAAFLSLRSLRHAVPALALIAFGAPAVVGCASADAGSQEQALESEAAPARVAEDGCTDLASPAEASDVELESGANPSARGGAVADGRYALTAVHIFGSAGRIRGPAAALLELRGDRFAFVMREGEVETRFTGTSAFAGTAFHLRLDCRSSDAATVLHPRGGYAADGRELRLYEDFRAARVEYVYVRQPEAASPLR